MYSTLHKHRCWYFTVAPLMTVVNPISHTKDIYDLAFMNNLAQNNCINKSSKISIPGAV